MNSATLIRQALDAGQGVLRLAPAWVPRAFLRPGGRLRLHPHDLFALGAYRGGIDERWLASTVKADNGPGTPSDEGLSYIEHDGQRTLLQDVVGEEWQVLCKLFDNSIPIPHHVHPNDHQVSAQGLRGKPEAYYFPPQYNQVAGPFPYTFFGLEPGTTRDQIRRCLERWDEGDNGILYHARAYRLKPGTGWQVDTNILHAPGTLVTYEPQAPSDTGAMFESICGGQPLAWDYLVKNFPPEHRYNLDAILDWIDWERNTDQYFFQRNFRPPVLAVDADQHREKWIVYGSPHFSARELSIAPKATVTIKDSAAYGALIVQGHGSINGLPAEVPNLIRFGQMTADEFFITAEAALAGVAITNESAVEPLVILKHYGPGHPDAKEFLV